MENSSSPFNIIFLDPPYGMDAVPVLDDIMQNCWRRAALSCWAGFVVSVVAAPLTLLRSKSMATQLLTHRFIKE